MNFSENPEKTCNYTPKSHGLYVIILTMVKTTVESTVFSVLANTHKKKRERDLGILCMRWSEINLH